MKILFGPPEFTGGTREEHERENLARSAERLAGRSEWTSEETAIATVVLFLVALGWATNLFTAWPAWLTP
ncbi:MAG: hypothetical protein AAB886_02560 [Patescibacteria group bacterium]